MFTTDSEIKPDTIFFEDAPDVVWQAVLNEAKLQGKISNMVEILRDDYPNQHSLIADLQAWGLASGETNTASVVHEPNSTVGVSDTSIPTVQSQIVNTEVLQSLTKLTGKQVGALERALLSAFDEYGLRRMVRTELEKMLEEIAGGNTYGNKVFSLITWAESTGKLSALIQGALNANPDSPDLRAFVASLSVNQ